MRRKSVQKAQAPSVPVGLRERSPSTLSVDAFLTLSLGPFILAFSGFWTCHRHSNNVESNINGHAQSKTGLDSPGILKSAFERAPEQEAMKAAYSAASASAGRWSASMSSAYAESK